MNHAKLIKDQLLNIDIPIYIAGHVKPDQDSIGSCLSLARVLRANNKEAYVLLEKKDNSIIKWQNDYTCIENKINHSNYCFVSLDLNEKKRLGIYEKDFDNAS